MDFNTLTLTLNTLTGAFSAGFGRLLPYIDYLLYSLGAIQLTLMGLWFAIDGGNERISKMLRRLLYLMFWAWLCRNFQTLARTFVNSLIDAGLIAGGAAPGNHTLLMDPSRIAGYGLDATEPLVRRIMDSGSIIPNLTDALVVGFCYLAIVAAFFIIAIQVLMAVTEFYLVVPLVSILMPFGMMESTKFLAEKGIGAVVASGVKLCSLAFIIAVVDPILRGLRLTPVGGEIRLNELLAMLLVTGAIAYLSWKIPQIVAGLLAGSPSLSAGDAAMAAATTVGAATAMGAMAKGIYDGAKSAVSGGENSSSRGPAGGAEGSPAPPTTSGSTYGGSMEGAMVSASGGSSSQGGSGAQGGSNSQGGSAAPAWASEAKQSLQQNGSSSQGRSTGGGGLSGGSASAGDMKKTG